MLIGFNIEPLANNSDNLFIKQQSLTYTFIGLGFSVVYILLAKLGLTFTSVADNITLIWPPTGFALFVLLVFGLRYWPWISIGAFAINVSTDIPVLAAAGIAVGNTLEAVAGMYLLKINGFNNHLSRVRDVLLLVFLAAAISTLISASIGAFSLAIFGVISWDIFTKAWTTWWMGDAMGNLVIAPLLLSWWYKDRIVFTHKSIFEAVFLFISLGFLTQFIFGAQYGLWDNEPPVSFMTFPFLIWASLRFGMRGATSSVLIIGVVLLVNIMLQQGPFSRGSTFESLTLLWLYTNFLAITSMVLASSISEQSCAETNMRYLALHDHLTGLPNRMALNDRIEQFINSADRHNQSFALLYIDLDRFKTINDSLGHSSGDELLKTIGQRLLGCLRKDDVVSRIGGDEFVILINEVQRPEQLYKVLNKLIDSINVPVKVKGLELHTSLSIGISLYPNDGQDAETLLKHADIAMYRAKGMGRNTYLYYSADMKGLADNRFSIENDLRLSVLNNEFSLHYQPQFDAKNKTIKAVEALLRWRKPDGSYSPPNEFIPILEETGQIITVGAWVLEHACRQLSQWHAAGWDHLRLSVNLSSIQLNNEELASNITRVLDKYKLPSACLELEITESILIRHDSTVETNLKQLVKLGVRLAIDDFGTGYSSLSYLHRLSIDTLKIDRSFIENVPGDKNSEAIVHAIVGLSRGLNLTLVAEGVENDKQRAFVTELGCDYIQGFLFSRPLPQEEFGQLLFSSVNMETLDT